MWDRIWARETRNLRGVRDLKRYPVGERESCIGEEGNWPSFLSAQNRARESICSPRSPCGPHHPEAPYVVWGVSGNLLCELSGWSVGRCEGNGVERVDEEKRASGRIPHGRFSHGCNAAEPRFRPQPARKAPRSGLKRLICISRNDN